MAGLNFNAQEHEPQQAFENLVPGWYTGKITDSELKPTKAGTGSYLELTIEIIAPQQYAGRKIWDRLNINNPNPTAVEIANNTLSAICHAVGVLQLQDSQQLHNLPLDVKVGLTKPTDDYPEPSNEVKGYRTAEGQVGAGQPAPQGPQGGGFAPQQQQQQAAPQQQQMNMQQQQGNFAPQQQQQQRQQQQAAPQGQAQGQQQGGWQNANPQAQQQQVGQQGQAQGQQQQGPAPELQQQQQSTDQAGQQAAQNGQAPWMQGQ